MKTILVVLVLLCAHAASAEDKLFRASLVSAIAAHGADLATTEHCLGSGRCRELNPFLLRFEQPAVFGAVKMGVAGLSLWATAKLHDSHPRWAIAANVAQTVGFTWIAVRNTRAVRVQK